MEGRGQENPVGPRLLKSFSEKLKARLDDCAKDPNVAGFKSVVCYRTGLDITIGPNRPAALMAMNGVYERFRSKGKNEPLRLADKPLNDLVVRKTVRIAAQHSKPGMVPLLLLSSLYRSQYALHHVPFLMQLHLHPPPLPLQCSSTRALATRISRLHVRARPICNR